MGACSHVNDRLSTPERSHRSTDDWFLGNACSENFTSSLHIVRYTIFKRDLDFLTSTSGQTIEHRGTKNMTKNRSIPLSLPALAVITGSFLSGAMLSISLITVPFLLDTNTQPAHMVRQWTRLYHYGHILLPSLSIITCLLYIYTAIGKRGSSKVPPRYWTSHLTAGAVTVLMVPFTLIFMAPTNNALFQIDEETKSPGGEMAASLDNVQALVRLWTKMHAIRSLFPLYGAVVGMKGLSNERYA
ncbi:DUF1772-domain-containing protein [Viridothelium virens]|uniref:DUF1772-domain-containing protein n=1 Tax=Viridothelium virens TaxID=1048519 RepID=A0A6A6H4E6_VIRVR|nr:DUF1772-domain-containing protein [Viridothelium virens]